MTDAWPYGRKPGQLGWAFQMDTLHAMHACPSVFCTCVFGCLAGRPCELFSIVASSPTPDLARTHRLHPLHAVGDAGILINRKGQLPCFVYSATETPGAPTVNHASDHLPKPVALQVFRQEASIRAQVQRSVSCREQTTRTSRLA